MLIAVIIGFAAIPVIGAYLAYVTASDIINGVRRKRAAEATARAYVAYCDAGIDPNRAHALAVSNRRAARVAI